LSFDDQHTVHEDNCLILAAQITSGDVMFDWDEYERWMDQARYTLASIKADLNFGSYSWACFKAHQAAEYALKAFLRGAGKTAFGYDLRELAIAAAEYCGFLEEVLEDALFLSKFYIPPRYPDSFPGGSPYQFYTRRDAESAFKAAERIIDWVDRCAERLKEAAGGKEEEKKAGCGGG